MHINGNHGYIGSHLSKVFSPSSGSDLCWFDSGNAEDFADQSHTSDVILHFAGHSSEPMCSNDPQGAWDNNVSKFRTMLEGLGDDQLLIYASSASVYAPSSGEVNERDFTSSSRPYDCTKIVCDAIAQMYINQGKKIVGLRLGTVAGLSRVQRVDTIINSMTKSALEKNSVMCVDPSVRRTVLFLDDLAEAIRLIIANPVPGIYNVGSLNSTVGEIAMTISTALNADLDIVKRNSNFYDFHLDCSLFVETFGDYLVTSLMQTVFDLYDGLPSVNQGRRDAAPH